MITPAKLSMHVSTLLSLFNPWSNVRYLRGCACLARSAWRVGRVRGMDPGLQWRTGPRRVAVRCTRPR